MRLYVWDGDITCAYGGRGFLAVLADDAEGARNVLRSWLQRAKEAGLRTLGPRVEGDWAEHLRVSGADAKHNEGTLKELNRCVSLASHELEPPGDWEGRCYQVKWEELFKMEPREVSVEEPGILAYYYGYEG